MIYSVKQPSLHGAAIRVVTLNRPSRLSWYKFFGRKKQPQQCDTYIFQCVTEALEHRDVHFDDAAVTPRLHLVVTLHHQVPEKRSSLTICHLIRQLCRTLTK